MNFNFLSLFKIFNVLFLMKLVNEIQNRVEQNMKLNENWFWDAVKILTLPGDFFFQVFLILNKFKYIVILQNEKYKKLKLCTISNINFSKISNFLLSIQNEKGWKWYYLSKISTGEQRRRVCSGEEWIRCYAFLTCNKKREEKRNYKI